MPSIINRRGRPPHPDILTPSEWQVLEGVRAGLTNQEIADLLGVTFHTVKYHISNMLSKLHLEDRQQLAAWQHQPQQVPSRKWPRFAFAPLGALKAVGTAGGAAVLAIGLAVASIVAIRSLEADGSTNTRASTENASAGQAVPTIGATPTPEGSISWIQPSPGVSAEFTGVTAARIGMRITVQLDRPIPQGSLPSARGLAVSSYGSFGERPVSITDADYPLGPDRTKWIIDLDIEPFPEGTHTVVVRIEGVDFITGAEQPLVGGQTGDFVALLRVSDAPQFTDLTSRVPQEIDTGFGWRYVIDGAALTGTTVAVTYHAEGDIESLRPSPPGDQNGEPIAVFSFGRPQTLELEVPRGASSIRVAFGSAFRVSADDGPPFEIESGDWSITIPLE